LVLRSPRPARTMPGQGLRTVHPRPYLPSFRAYLFHPKNILWLDVMVWSSAQAHSGDDMVHHACGADRAHLAAGWARDTLGLAREHYRAYLPFVTPPHTLRLNYFN